MTNEEYQRKAARTIPDKYHDYESDPGQARESLINFTMGLSGEAGEFSEIVKKHLFHGHEMDIEKARKEIGDVLWYVAAICTIQGWRMDSILAENIAKLEARYPDRFSADRSINRVDD